jgi:hypothetical protein
MRRPSRSPAESIFARGLWQHALWVGPTMAAVCLAHLVGPRAAGQPWQTMVFTTAGPEGPAIYRPHGPPALPRARAGWPPGG